ncbi:hypothetical protein U9M48_002824 [Paspalum notatum var. saurae]|uniref:HVA22-like protein n=1 Tax=Paspalum notatum var. saurae TaxID=547442 RepID=A0AAQ3PS70_PASNO
MGKLWTVLSHLHSLEGNSTFFLHKSFIKLWSSLVSVYRYASVQAMESSSKLDDEQWLAYWLLYSFITLMEMVLQPLIHWIPVWYELKLLVMAWLVLPNFRGAAFIYNKFVREQVKKHNGILAATAVSTSSNGNANKDKRIPCTSPKQKMDKRKILSMLIPRKLRF